MLVLRLAAEVLSRHLAALADHVTTVLVSTLLGALSNATKVLLSGINATSWSGTGRVRIKELRHVIVSLLQVLVVIGLGVQRCSCRRWCLLVQTFHLRHTLLITAPLSSLYQVNRLCLRVNRELVIAVLRELLLGNWVVVGVLLVCWRWCLLPKTLERFSLYGRWILERKTILLFLLAHPIGMLNSASRKPSHGRIQSRCNQVLLMVLARTCGHGWILLLIVGVRAAQVHQVLFQGAIDSSLHWCCTASDWVLR